MIRTQRSSARRCVALKLCVALTGDDADEFLVQPLLLVGRQLAVVLDCVRDTAQQIGVRDDLPQFPRQLRYGEREGPRHAGQRARLVGFVTLQGFR